MQSGTVLLVDGTGTLTGTNVYRSIDSAANAALPGATIRVLGMTDGMGNPVAYSNNPVVYAGIQQPEVWPIDLKAGCKLEPYDPSIPVYIWATSSTGVHPLIDVVDTPHNPASTGPTRIESLRLGAANQGIRVHHQTGSWSVLIKDCKFAGLGDAIDAKATNVTTSIAVRGCQIRDDLPSTPNPPAPVPPSRGILLQSGYLSGPGVLIAEVTGLTTSGSFTSMSPVGWEMGTGTIDLAWLPHSISAATRLIEVYPAFGEHEYPDLWSANPTYTRSQVPEVRLTVNGGDLDGQAVAGVAGGWDIGLYAHATGTNDDAPYNFTSGFEVTTYGTTFRNCGLSGIVGATYGEGRGSIDLGVGTRVRDSGLGQSPASDIYNGIHMFAMESYLALTGSGFQSDGNAGHGIWLNFGGEHGADHAVPEGLYVGVQGAGAHANGRHGIAMKSASSDSNQAGVVGGTTHQDFNGGLHRMDELEGFVQDFGTGFINACAISNNGLAGIHALITGIGYSSPNEKCATASAGLTNNAIWNNAGGGITIQFDDRTPSAALPGGLCLLPVAHDTIANNGPWSMEVVDAGTTGGTYEVDNFPYDQTILRTRVFNSILFRDYQTASGLDDFGNRLEQLARFDDDILPIAADRVGMAGNRAKTNLTVPPQASLWNQAPHAFFGPVVLTSWSMKMFALDPGASSYADFNNSTPPYLNVHAPAAGADFLGNARPTPSLGLRDKGISEHP